MTCWTEWRQVSSVPCQLFPVVGLSYRAATAVQDAPERSEDTKEVRQLWCLQALWQAE